MKLPDYLNSLNEEFIGIDGELFNIKIELVHFTDFEASTKYQLQQLLDADTIAQASLDLLSIQNEDKRLQKFGLCRFGGFDNKADIADDIDTTEYYDCGLRGRCPVEGKLCKFIEVENGHLTPREIEFIKLIAQDLADKEIADKLGISYTTAATHRKNIQHKIGCNSKVGICRFAIEKNII